MVLALALGSALLFGAAGFFAGRFSVRQTVPGLDSKTASAAVKPATNISKTIDEAATRPITASQAKPASKGSGWDEKEWNQLMGKPGTPARNTALADMIEKLAAIDPDRAMDLAQAEGNLKLRESLTQAALHGWGRVAPADAADWALALPDANARENALSSIFAGAIATDPEQAVRLGRELIEQEPDEAVSYGSRLIDALCSAGNFETAAQMAAGGDKEQRSFWLAGAYSKWAEFQPEQAAAAAAAITDPELRNEALHGIVGGWAEADPASLVQFVTKLPPETDRSSILSQALQYWVKHDAATASRWINSHAPGPEMDEGVAAVATMESVQPEVAVGWATSIFNPTLRSETLATLIRGWMADDLPAARQYFEVTKNLLPEDRQQLAEALAAISGQSADP
jgi:hypothetical protein